MLLFRALISALLVGIIAFGNTLQVAISNGQEPTKWQTYSAVIGGVVLMLNDLKSRFTPATDEGAKTAVVVGVQPAPPAPSTTMAPVVQRP